MAKNSPRDASACKPDAGKLEPVINHNRCEGKEDCLRVCPYNVFELRTLTAEEKQTRSLLARVKIAVHGGKQAFAVRAMDCHACGLCVQACPEKAITLVRAGSSPV